jgi:hypothetical protein
MRGFEKSLARPCGTLPEAPGERAGVQRSVGLHKRREDDSCALQIARGKSGLLAFSGFDNERRFELLLCRFGCHACPIAGGY